MTGHAAPTIELHKDRELFREVVNFTASETGFLPRLIEKDYFCTLALQYLSAFGNTLVFKGGTCLAKVHAGFYRLSEDLDFVISTPFSVTRAERSRRVRWLKEALSSIGEQPLDFRLITPLTGANDSTQYNAVIGYSSLLGRQEETIRIETGLREPLLTPTIVGMARTLLLNPISGVSFVPQVSLSTISYMEAIAEKFRAALSRREVAIRDFYDIDYAVNRLGFDPLSTELIALLRQKLAVPDNEPVDISAGRMVALRLQLESQLKPVLRTRDFAGFDLNRAIATVGAVSSVLM